MKYAVFDACNIRGGSPSITFSSLYFHVDLRDFEFSRSQGHILI